MRRTAAARVPEVEAEAEVEVEVEAEVAAATKRVAAVPAAGAAEGTKVAEGKETSAQARGPAASAWELPEQAAARDGKAR